MRITQTCWTHLDSPIGTLTLSADADAIVALSFARHDGEAMPPEDPDARDDDAPLLREAVDQLSAYFAGERTSFDLPLRPAGTLFQQRVWSELRKIPHGQAISYGELADRVGNPLASRAVGGANGRNPIGIIIPCHRVIASDRTLGGFGGGLNVKRWLLNHERVALKA